MEIDPILWSVVLVAFAVFCVGLVLRVFKQPHVIGYILVGVLFGFFGIVEPTPLLEQAGNLGIILLLFFIGLHVSIDDLVCRWRVAIFGTLGQIICTFLLVWFLGSFLSWPFTRIVLFSFVISLSSTAVILKILGDWKELNTKVGKNVLGILLVQDLAIIPMLMVLDIMEGGSVSPSALAIQIIGAVLIIALVTYVVRHGSLKSRFSKELGNDHEMQVFLALVVCFGFALVTGLLGLSTALGAFVAGIIVGAVRGTTWIKESLESLHVILVALFFIYIGLLINMDFFLAQWKLILFLVSIVLILNTGLNALVLKILGDTWQESIYAGALLSQIGEFSFLLVTVGFASGIIVEFGYQLMVATIALTLLVSPFWIQSIKRALNIARGYRFEDR